MDINYIYISDDIIILLFSMLNLKSKIQLSQINKYIYKRFGGEHLKKYNIYNLLHTNYDTFYDYLQKYTYTHNEYNKLLKISIDNIPLLRMNPAIYLYDLKYIFEIFFII